MTQARRPSPPSRPFFSSPTTNDLQGEVPLEDKEEEGYRQETLSDFRGVDPLSKSPSSDGWIRETQSSCDKGTSGLWRTEETDAKFALSCLSPRRGSSQKATFLRRADSLSPGELLLHPCSGEDGACSSEWKGVSKERSDTWLFANVWPLPRCDEAFPSYSPTSGASRAEFSGIQVESVYPSPAVSASSRGCRNDAERKQEIYRRQCRNTVLLGVATVVFAALIEAWDSLALTYMVSLLLHFPAALNGSFVFKASRRRRPLILCLLGLNAVVTCLALPVSLSFLFRIVQNHQCAGSSMPVATPAKVQSVLVDQSTDSLSVDSPKKQTLDPDTPDPTSPQRQPAQEGGETLQKTGDSLEAETSPQHSFQPTHAKDAREAPRSPGIQREKPPGLHAKSSSPDEEKPRREENASKPEDATASQTPSEKDSLFFSETSSVSTFLLMTFLLSAAASPVAAVLLLWQPSSKALSELAEQTEEHKQDEDLPNSFEETASTRPLCAALQEGLLPSRSAV